MPLELPMIAVIVTGYISIIYMLMTFITKGKERKKIIDKYLDSVKHLNRDDALAFLEKIDNRYYSKTSSQKKLEGITTKSIYENYRLASEKEAIQCNFFRILLISTIVIFTILIMTLQSFFFINDITVLAFANRTLVVLPFLVLILFAAREASRHRKSFIINRQKFLDLNTIDEYIKEFSEKDKIAVKKDLCRHFFNHKEFDYKCREELISKELIDVLKRINSNSNDAIERVLEIINKRTLKKKHKS